MKRKQIEFFLLIGWTIPGLYISLKYGSDYLTTALILLGVPAAYLTYRQPKCFKKLAVFSTIISIPGAAIVSYLAHKDLTWFNPSFFPRIYGVYPVEDFVWGFIYVYAITVAYEYFYENEKSLKFPLRFKGDAFRVVLLASLFSIAAYIYPHALYIPYFYPLFVLIFFIAIPWTLLYKHQKLILKVVKLEVFFLIPSLAVEYVANINHNWWFPGKHFIGYVTALGVTIPLEEFLWIILAVPAFIVYYELLADDGK